MRSHKTWRINPTSTLSYLCLSNRDPFTYVCYIGQCTRQKFDWYLVSVNHRLFFGFPSLAPPDSCFTFSLALLNIQLTFQSLERLSCKGKQCRKHTQHKVTQYKAGGFLCSLKVREDTTVSNPVSVVKPSQFSTRRLRPPRRLSWDWNVSTARPRPNGFEEM